MRTTRHSLLAKGIMVLLSLLVLMFTVTYSWFGHFSTADSSGIAARVESTGDFEYAIGFYNNGTGGAYKVTPFTNQTSALDLEHLLATDNVTYNLLHDYKPIDITGDGRTLIRPSMSSGNSSIVTSTTDFSIAQPNVQYISFDLYFRSASSGVPINLGSGSWVKGGCEINNFASMIGSSAASTFNKSTYGNFSRDAIAGAVRIAFIPYDYSTTLSNIPATLSAFQDNTPNYLHDRAMFVWLPRPDLKLNSTNSLTGWTLTQAADTSTAADASTDGHIGSNIHKYYNIFECQPYKSAADGGIASSDSERYHKEVAYDNTVTPAVLATASQNFSTTNPSVSFVEGGKTYYYSKVNVRIWVEGTDLEARRATSGGKFEVNFQFKTT